MESSTGFRDEISIISYTTPIFSSLNTSLTECQQRFDPTLIVAIEETPFDASTFVDPLEADSALSDIYSNPIMNEIDFVQKRIANILISMTEVERRILLVPIEERTLEPDSVLFLKDRSTNQEIPVSAADFYHAMLENWPNECKHGAIFDEEFSVFEAKTTRRIPSVPLPKPPHCFSKTSIYVKWSLAVSFFTMVAIICGVLYIFLSSLESRDRAKNFSNNFTVIPQFQNSITTTGFDSHSLRYDHRLRHAFITSFIEDVVHVLTWSGIAVQDLQFHVNQMFDNFPEKGELRCSLISITANTKPAMFCVSSLSVTNESSFVINVFETDDQLHRIHFPSSDSVHLVHLIELIEADEPVMWYSMQLRNIIDDTTITTNTGVGFGRISVSDAKFVRISTGFANETDRELDKYWFLYAMRVERSDNSLNALLLQSITRRAGICNFAYINSSLKSNMNYCIYLENLYYFIIDFISASKIGPLHSLDPPKATFVRGKYLKGQEWIKIWMIYAVARNSDQNNWSLAIGHLHLSLYDTNGNHLRNVAHNTAEDVKLPQQYPTGLVVASEDSLFVWFSGRDGSSCLARYTFTVCFGEEPIDCSQLVFEI